MPAEKDTALVDFFVAVRREVRKNRAALKQAKTLVAFTPPTQHEYRAAARTYLEAETLSQDQAILAVAALYLSMDETF